MSERIPTAEDIRLALIEVGYTHYEADDAIEAVKRRTARDRVATLLYTKETLELVVNELRHDLKVALAEVADLGDENARLERIIQAPLSMKDLEAAWEAAEQADECRKDDVLIMQDPVEGYSVWRTGDADYLARSTRILSRAPREPWADLADALRGTVWERLSGDVDGLAAAVHALGWRKGGDES